MIKMARFFVLHKALRLDPRSAEIRRGMAGRTDRRRFPGDMVEMDEMYTYEADEGYDSTPPSPSVRDHSPMSSSVLGHLTQEQGRCPQRTFPEWVQYMVDTFMVRGTMGPVQWLLGLRTYGMKVFFNTPSEGHVGWQSPDQLLYRQIHFTMGDFRGFAVGLVGQLRQQLMDRLMFCTDQTPPPIPWHGLYDDPTQNEAGWRFLQDSRTRWPVDGREWLLQRASREPAFMEPHGQGFHMRRVDRFYTCNRDLEPTYH